MIFKQLGSTVQYEERRFLLLKGLEDLNGSARKVHDDGAGNATIGIGYNLKTPGHLKTLLEDIFQLDFSDPATTDLLAELDAIVNNGSLSQQQLQDQFEAAWQRYPLKTRPTFELNDTDIRNLFEDVQGTYEAHVDAFIPAQFAAQLENSWERMALFSMAYNSPAILRNSDQLKDAMFGPLNLKDCLFQK